MDTIANFAGPVYTCTSSFVELALRYRPDARFLFLSSQIPLVDNKVNTHGISRRAVIDHTQKKPNSASDICDVVLRLSALHSYDDVQVIAILLSRQGQRAFRPYRTPFIFQLELLKLGMCGDLTGLVFPVAAFLRGGSHVEFDVELVSDHEIARVVRWARTSGSPCGVMTISLVELVSVFMFTEVSLK